MKNPQLTKLASVTAAGVLMAAAASQPATASTCAPPLGQPDAITYLVPDVHAARQQLESGTGVVFTRKQRSVKVTIAGERRSQRLNLVEAIYDPAQGPTIELVQVSSTGSGAWPGDGRGHVALSYQVADVREYAAGLRSAGMRQVVAGDEVAVWQGAGGLIIRLDEHLPASTPPSSSAAPINFGAPVSIALYPCDPQALASQLSQALGLTWRDPDVYQLPWALADGSSASPHSASTTSKDGLPYVTVADAASHGFPGEDTCATDYLPSYLIYATSDVNAAGAQLAAAGMQFIGTVPTMITLYISAGRVPVQVVHTSFVPQ